MKKIASAILSLILIGTAAIPVSAANAADLKIVSSIPESPSKNTSKASDGYLLQINGTDTASVIGVMVPLQTFAEKLGFTVKSDGSSLLVDNGILHTEITVGIDQYIVSTSVEGLIGTTAPFSLGAAPYTANGVTYVPLALFKVLLGNEDDAISIEGNRIKVQTSDGKGANVQIPNPFADCASLEEASKLAGFPISVPDSVSGFSNRVIRVMKERMTEIIYLSDTQEIRIRKGPGNEDISGDYNNYEKTWSIALNGKNVLLKGNSGKIFNATWSENGYSYSITFSDGATQDLVGQLVQTTK